ncbi:hepatocyte growth factor activator isoform X2 [Corythoichthys intestinalis]|uniref:hepatocyte growth factor activator isoform X2 n=1 Tax=Corythoichthys intestinalis TaxID=161448 RepID=UPI0025A52BD3|nr:hepatocyte growth factor activator isoform X2 [Corythoichthys intestinalis]
MTYARLLFLPFVLSATGPVGATVISNVTDAKIEKVVTTTGKQCVLPFRQGGRIHHHCVTVFTSRPWCSLTSNFDRDRKWGFCAPEPGPPNGSFHTSRRLADLCRRKACQNGGNCTLVSRGPAFRCSCPEGFSGRFCEREQCYETLHLRHYDAGQSWGRIHLRNVEQCTCVDGKTECRRTRYTACRSNPCRNDGTCRTIATTGEKVCHCRRGYGGPRCSLEPESECYDGRGVSYRGAASATASGDRCLPWDSDLLYDELHVGTVRGAFRKGLGKHAHCRNPDGDKKPWCYTLSNDAISWEYCTVPSCKMPLCKYTYGKMSHPEKNIHTTQSSLTFVGVASSSRMSTWNARRPVPGPVEKPTCGTKHKKRVWAARGRIMGGNSALPGSHPWMAAIYIGRSDFCAGTLIASCWVVSAAHCFLRNPLLSQLRVVLGQHRFNVSGPDTRTFGVDKYIFPKHFSVFNPTLHDIVLIKLKKRDGRCVKRTRFIRPICLPDSGVAFPDGFCCSISGWGHMHEKADGYSNLQEAGVRLIGHDACKKPEVYGRHVTADMICAGLDGCVDACQGDSGGPLACAKDDVNFLYGIISWGEGCGRSGKPGVYTKVANYVDWINSVIRRTAQKLSTLTRP